MVSGVVAPGKGGLKLPRSLVREMPDLARAVVCCTLYQRAGHRGSYEDVDWERYRAHVGVFQRRGPWRIAMVESTELDAWSCEALGLPHRHGWYTTLSHDERGLVMSDLPAEIAGCLDFLDHAKGRVLVNGLGLGIVPAYLLAHRPVSHVDVVEIDQDVIDLMTDGAQEPDAPNAWAADPRLRIHHGDAHTFRWLPGTRWDFAWHDIWDTVSPDNLPSMRLLHRRYRHRVGCQLSWEQEECRAQRARRRQQAQDPYRDL